MQDTGLPVYTYVYICHVLRQLKDEWQQQRAMQVSFWSLPEVSAERYDARGMLARLAVSAGGVMSLSHREPATELSAEAQLSCFHFSSASWRAM